MYIWASQIWLVPRVQPNRICQTERQRWLHWFVWFILFSIKVNRTLWLFSNDPNLKSLVCGKWVEIFFYFLKNSPILWLFTHCMTMVFCVYLLRCFDESLCDWFSFNFWCFAFFLPTNKVYHRRRRRIIYLFLFLLLTVILARWNSNRVPLFSARTLFAIVRAAGVPITIWMKIKAFPLFTKIAILWPQ